MTVAKEAAARLLQLRLERTVQNGLSALSRRSKQEPDERIANDGQNFFSQSKARENVSTEAGENDARADGVDGQLAVLQILGQLVREQDVAQFGSFVAQDRIELVLKIDLTILPIQ